MKEVIDTKNMFDFVTRLNTTSESKVINVWRNVVSKIRTSHDDEDDEKRIPIGERLASNTRVINLKNGVLLVETDHSGWIQYLKVYQKFILRGLKMALPDLTINTLAFRIVGTNVNLSESYEDTLEKAKNDFSKKWEEDEKKLNFLSQKTAEEDIEETAGEEEEENSSNTVDKVLMAVIGVCFVAIIVVLVFILVKVNM